MEVRTCKNCKRLFNYLTGPMLCAACRDMFEDIFIDVKTFIRANPGVTMQDVMDEFEDLPASQIKQWVREERLQFSTAEGSGITCEKCGLPITSGRYCDICKRDIANNLSQAYAKPKKEIEKPLPTRGDKEGMRFLNK